MALDVGLNAKAYHGTAGSEPATEIARVRDQSYSIECAAISSADHASSGWREKKAGLLRGTADLTLTWDSTQASQIALRDAWKNGTLIAIKMIKAAGLVATTPIGVWFDAVVTEFSPDQPLEDGQTVSVSFKSDGALTRVTVPV